MIPLKRARSALLAGVIILTAGPAVGQDYFRRPCPAGPTPRFEDHLQSLWYRRFWTGDCKDLPALGCRAGRPYWNQVVQTLVARAPANKRAEVASRTCRLGSRIGFEWTRPKNERRIDTKDLQAFNGILDHAPDTLAGLASVEGRVKEKLGS